MPAWDPAIGCRLNVWCTAHAPDRPARSEPSRTTSDQLSGHRLWAWHIMRTRRVAMVGLLLMGTGGCAVGNPTDVEPVRGQSAISSPSALPPPSEVPYTAESHLYPTTAELLGILSDPQAHTGEHILVYAEVRRVEQDDESTTFLARDVTNSDLVSDGCGEVCGYSAVFTGEAWELTRLGPFQYVEASVTVDGWISYRGRTLPHFVVQRLWTAGGAWE